MSPEVAGIRPDENLRARQAEARLNVRHCPLYGEPADGVEDGRIPGGPQLLPDPEDAEDGYCEERLEGGDGGDGSSQQRQPHPLRPVGRARTEQEAAGLAAKEGDQEAESRRTPSWPEKVQKEIRRHRDKES